MIVLKKSLHYHYIRIKKNLIISTILTVIYFALLIAPGFDNYFFNQSVNLIRYWDQRATYNNGRAYFITIIVFQVFLNIYLGVFAVFNLLTIEFKIYLWDLLYGRRIIDVIVSNSNK